MHKNTLQCHAHTNLCLIENFKTFMKIDDMFKQYLTNQVLYVTYYARLDNLLTQTRNVM